MKGKIKTISIWTMLLCSTLFMSVGLNIGSYYSDYENNKEINKEKEISNFHNNVKELCGDLEFEEMAYCLRDFINRSYNYHAMKETETMGRDYIEIYNNGGDCLDYSLLYSKLINEISYYDSKIIMSLEDEHAYVQMKDWAGNVCLLDLNHDPLCEIVESHNDAIYFRSNVSFTKDVNVLEEVA